MIETISKLSKDPSKQNPQQVVKGKKCVCVSDTELQDYICKRPFCLWAIMQNNRCRKIAQWSVRQNCQPLVLFEQTCCNDVLSWEHLDVMWGTCGCWIYITNTNILFLIYSEMTFHTILLSLVFLLKGFAACTSLYFRLWLVCIPSFGRCSSCSWGPGSSCVLNVQVSCGLTYPVADSVQQVLIAEIISKSLIENLCMVRASNGTIGSSGNRNGISSIVKYPAEGTPASFRVLAQKSCKAVCGSHHGISLWDPSAVL